MRRSLFTIIRPKAENSRASLVYDIFMMIMIMLSMVPLMVKEQTFATGILEKVTVSIFILDYILRWGTADLYYEEKGYSRAKAFARYPFSFMAIMDLLTILPALHLLSGGFKTLRLLRLGRIIKVSRFFKAFRYSRNMEMVLRVIIRQKGLLIAVAIFAAGYIFLSALLIFQIEPDIFDDFFDALYWATVSLTTIGFGDIVTVTKAGKLIAMVTAFFGVSIVTMPAGIIAAGYMEELRKIELDESIKEQVGD